MLLMLKEDKTTQATIYENKITCGYLQKTKQTNQLRDASANASLWLASLFIWTHRQSDDTKTDRDAEKEKETAEGRKDNKN
jgi:hypothetical protein